MPLRNGYALIVGKITHYEVRIGSSNHVHLKIKVGNDIYDVAVNTYSTDQTHLEFYFNPDYHGKIVDELKKLKPGVYHKGSNLPKSLEIDYIKMKLFPKNQLKKCSNDGPQCTILDHDLFDLVKGIHDSLCQECTFYIFGEPYSHGGLGIHNVHMNQNNSNSRFARESAPGQDGCMFVQRGDGTFAAYFSKFKTQSL